MRWWLHPHALRAYCGSAAVLWPLGGTAGRARRAIRLAYVSWQAGANARLTPRGVTVQQAALFSPSSSWIACLTACRRSPTHAVAGGERRSQLRGAGALGGAGLAAYLLMTIIISAPCPANAASGECEHVLAMRYHTPVPLSRTAPAGCRRAPALAPAPPPAATPMSQHMHNAPCTLQVGWGALTDRWMQLPLR